jgi:hypothetical protein
MSRFTGPSPAHELLLPELQDPGERDSWNLALVQKTTFRGDDLS